MGRCAPAADRPYVMSQQPLDYGISIRHRRSLVRVSVCVAVILLGLPAFLYGLAGLAYVVDAIKSGDRSDSPASIVLLLALAAGGITMIVLGILGLRRKAAT